MKKSYKIRQIQYIVAKREILVYSQLFFRNNTKVPIVYRQKSLFWLSNKNKTQNISKMKKYCIYTGRVRFILKNLNISRMSLKYLITSSFLVGFRKSS